MNVGETGDMEPGTSMTLTLDLAPGHYAVVCNLVGHYANGMHEDFWVTPKGSTPVQVALGESDPNTMYIHMSQPYAPEGTVSFIVTNEGTETHEFVVLQTKTAAADFPIVLFEGEANRIDEDAKGVTNVGETGDMEPGTSHDDDARPVTGSLRGRVQPGRALRQRHARGLLGDPRQRATR